MVIRLYQGLKYLFFLFATHSHLSIYKGSQYVAMCACSLFMMMR